MSIPFTAVVIHRQLICRRYVPCPSATRVGWRPLSVDHHASHARACKPSSPSRILNLFRRRRPSRGTRSHSRPPRNNFSHQHHGDLPCGSARLSRRRLPRLLPGLHLTVALRSHRTWPIAERRGVHLQCSRRGAAGMLHSDLLHRSGSRTERLA